MYNLQYNFTFLLFNFVHFSFFIFTCVFCIVSSVLYSFLLCHEPLLFLVHVIVLWQCD